VFTASLWPSGVKGSLIAPPIEHIVERSREARQFAWE